MIIGLTHSSAAPNLHSSTKRGLMLNLFLNVVLYRFLSPVGTNEFGAERHKQEVWRKEKDKQHVVGVFKEIFTEAKHRTTPELYFYFHHVALLTLTVALSALLSFKKAEAANQTASSTCHLHSPTMWWRSPCLLLPILFSFLVLFVRGATASDFRICAYNVQKFDLAKSKNTRVMHTLTRILSRYDICLLQEVMSPDAIKSLLKSLNRYDGYSYLSVSSKNLGNSPDNMQQYVFIYRKQTVNVTDQHQYQKKQSFVREPFAVQFQSKKTAIKKFVLVPLHTEPHQAVQEIDRLYDVFEEVSKKWNNKNVMFLGDFHAGCAYITRTDKKKIRLFANTTFSWLIGDKVDTTVSDLTSCPYDRIVIHGNTFLKAIQPFSAKVFNFPKEFKLTKTKALDLSDHLPVEVRLKSSAPLLQATPLMLLLTVSVIVQSFLSAL